MSTVSLGIDKSFSFSLLLCSWVGSFHIRMCCLGWCSIRLTIFDAAKGVVAASQRELQRLVDENQKKASS